MVQSRRSMIHSRISWLSGKLENFADIGMHWYRISWNLKDIDWKRVCMQDVSDSHIHCNMRYVNHQMNISGLSPQLTTSSLICHQGMFLHHGGKFDHDCWQIKNDSRDITLGKKVVFTLIYPICKQSITFLYKIFWVIDRKIYLFLPASSGQAF